jgi:hypothetical protein
MFRVCHLVQHSIGDTNMAILYYQLHNAVCADFMCAVFLMVSSFMFFSAWKLGYCNSGMSRVCVCVCVYASNYVKNLQNSCKRTVNPLKTKRTPLYLKTQSLPRSIHFISVIKTHHFMLYAAEVTVCIQISTTHINTVWAECWILNLLVHHVTK